MKDLEKLQSRIDYHFNNEKLLLNALTHSSYTSEHNKSYNSNNERLEFLGDAYLDAIVGHKLYGIIRDCGEGVLTRKRADVVCEESLADIAREIELGEYLILGHGEELTGGRNKDSMLADALEAVIGAVIEDSDYEAGKEVVLRLFAGKIRDAVQGKLNKDYKSHLQERLQQKYHSNEIEYVIVAEEGPAHDKLFTAQVILKGKVLGTGTGKSKSKAEQAAACDVISKGEI